MDDSLGRREACRPRKASFTAELGANASLQDGEGIYGHPAREAYGFTDRPSASTGRTERRILALPAVHQRHMPKEPAKFHIPRKTKEKRALFQYVSSESREYEDMMNILTSSYIDTGSTGCFTYCKPRIVHSELLEKEFVEKRREMKTEGRTDKELEDSYCFLLADASKLPALCEKGLFVGEGRISVLGNPSKGVYLSRYSDLLQVNPLTPGSAGEILIFKVLKGKVKSIYENLKNALDPTPRFDSHISKNASKVTSLTSYRAFELTQQYFYEYSFDELRQRPRQVCPYAVVSFQFKGKDSAIPNKPLGPIRLNSQSAEASTERAQFTVWSGDLVKGDEVLYQVSLRSFSPPFLPHKLPEKMEIGCCMRLEKVTKVLSTDVFSYNLYSSSQEVVINGHCCSLLEVTDRNRSTTCVTKLLHVLEVNRVVLVTPLTERGFLFLLSSVQMASPADRGESWKRCLQALFVFPESRDVSKSTSKCTSFSHDASETLTSACTVMPGLNQFIPALHHALVKARANPPPELAAGVECQAREYLIGQNDCKVRQYPMGEYDAKLDEHGKLIPAPKHHRVNLDGYLRSYLYSPALYLLSVARARKMMEAHCSLALPQEVRVRRSSGEQREAIGRVERGGGTNSQQTQQLIDLVLACKRNAETEVRREEGREGFLTGPGRKRKLEQRTAERTLKFLKASQRPAGFDKIPVESRHVSACPSSLSSVIGSVGLKDVDLREDGSELANRLQTLLTGLQNAASGTANQSHGEIQGEGQVDSSPFDRLAAKLGLPTNCDIDLRRQEELEEHTAGSVSSLEGFSPSGEISHHVPAGRGEGLCRRAGGYEEQEQEQEQEDGAEIPWVLIPITGLDSERYSQSHRNIPRDPRFHYLAMAAGLTTTTKPPGKTPTLSPEPSPPPSPSLCLSPDSSPPPSQSQCPSPEPSPPLFPSQCPSPDPSPPPSPSQCPSPEPSPPSSPPRCLSPEASPTQYPFPELSPPHSLSRCPFPPPSHLHTPSYCLSQLPNELHPLKKDHNFANKKPFAPATFWEFAGMCKVTQRKPQWEEKQNEDSSSSVSNKSLIPPASNRSTCPSVSPTEQEQQDAEGRIRDVNEVQAELLKEGKAPQPGEKGHELGQEEEMKLDMMHKAASNEEQMRDSMEIEGGSLFFPTMPSPPAHLVRNIESIVDTHLGDFSSDMQHLLQEEGLQYNLPQSPHCASALPHTLPNTLVSPFSQYVSFYNPCPPVQDYVSSLQDSINGMIQDYDACSPSRKSDGKRTEKDSALASHVSAFVASIRAANAKTDSDDEVSVVGGEPTAAVSRGAEAWRPDTAATQFPDATNNSNSRTSDVPMFASVRVHQPASSAIPHVPSNQSPQSACNPKQSSTLQIDRTLAHNIRQTPDTGTTSIAFCNSEAGSSLAGVNRQVTLPGFSSVYKPSVEPSQPSDRVSTPSHMSDNEPSIKPAPPASALTSLISQLQPEMFNNLMEIIKDVQRNSLQFYVHSPTREDQLKEEIKEYLLKQGNVEQSPVAFMNQETSDSRLLVIINNKDIAGHVHKIPVLASLKRQQSVVFLGIDSLEDISNNSYNELFVSGGCIVSDDLILNPDFLSQDRLASLLMFLEKRSSPESDWRWKIHCKTHKKLKEQARFRRDAANLLDVLTTYHKRQIVEFLPYHHCDMVNHQSPDLRCLIELQARYTQYRHTIFLTEHGFEKFSTYSSCGIIVASIEEILNNFTKMVGYHDIKDKQPITEDLLPPKGHMHFLNSGEKVQHLLQQSSSSLPNVSDQLVPEASCKEGVPHHSRSDLKMLQLAISTLRAERQAQQQQQKQQRLDSQAGLSINPLTNFLPNHTGSGHVTPPLGQVAPTESVQLTAGRKAVTATLQLIHSTLQTDLEKEQSKEGSREDQELPTMVQRRGVRLGGGEPVRSLEGNKRNCDISTCVRPSTPSFNQNTATVAAPSDHKDLTNDSKEKTDQQEGESFPKAADQDTVSSSTTSCPGEGDRSRDKPSGQELSTRREGAVPGQSVVIASRDPQEPGNISMVTEQKLKPNPAASRPQQPRQHLQRQNDRTQQLNEHLRQSYSQQQWNTNLLQHPNPNFSLGPQGANFAALGGVQGIRGSPVWPAGLVPASTTALVWGFQQTGGDFISPGLLEAYHDHAGQGSNGLRGWQRGGGGYNGL